MMMNDVNKLENIVKDNPSFYWDGWDLVHIKEDRNAYMNNNGIFKDNKWYSKTVFKLENGGWNIPDRILKSV